MLSSTTTCDHEANMRMQIFSNRRNSPVAAALAVLLCNLGVTGCVPSDDGADAAVVDASARHDAGHSGIDIGHDAGTSNGTWLFNAPPVDPPTLLAPDPGEEGHWAAARLTPPSYPFDVSIVSYTVGDGAAGNVNCSGTLSHQLQLYAESSVAPPATPAPDFSVTVPAATPDQIGHMGRTVTQTVDPPLRLAQGEHLFVAIQLGGTHPEVLCLQVNDVGPADGNRNYWSGAVAPPFSWVQLDSFGLDGSLLISAFGQVVD